MPDDVPGCPACDLTVLRPSSNWHPAPGPSLQIDLLTANELPPRDPVVAFAEPARS